MMQNLSYIFAFIFMIRKINGIFYTISFYIIQNLMENEYFHETALYITSFSLVYLWTKFISHFLFNKISFPSETVY